MSLRRVVITGLGAASPFGDEVDALWAALLEQRSAISRLTAFDPSGFRSQVGCEIPKFSMGDYIPKTYRKNAKVMCRDIQIALIAAYKAVKDAGLRTRCLLDRGEAEAPAIPHPSRFGANIGAGLICADLEELAGALATAADEQGRFSLAQWGSDGMSNLTPLWLLKFLPNMLACHVTIVHDAQAPSNTITCGEASSHLAIGEAFRTIQRGAADVCICGGAESKMNCMGSLREDLFGRLSTSFNDDPQHACRPFDQRHEGTALSEGGGLVILEDLAHALSRDARIYGEVVGFGASCNTHSWKQADPSGVGIATAMTKAIASAAMEPPQIDLIATFGTGIPEHDISESAAIRQVFANKARHIPSLAIKGAVGNNGAGSGALDFIVAVLALRHNTVPPSVNSEQLAAKCQINLVTAEPIDARINSFISTAYALSGGQTASLVVKRFEDRVGGAAD